MDDLNAQLSALLSDPAAMEQVRKVAANLFPDGSKLPEESADVAPQPESPGPFAGLDVGALAGILARLKKADNEQVHLIMALRPLLSEKRRQRADTAVKLLKLIDLLPLLRESGILLF